VVTVYVMRQILTIVVIAWRICLLPRLASRKIDVPHA